MSRVGEVVLVNFPFTSGASEKVRPALVLGCSDANPDDLSLAYITTQVDRYIALPSVVLLSQDDLESGTLRVSSLIRLDKVALINASLLTVLARLKPAKTQEVLRAYTKLATRMFAAEKFLAPSFTPGQSVVPPSGKVIGAKELQNMVEASQIGRASCRERVYVLV